MKVVHLKLNEPHDGETDFYFGSMKAIYDAIHAAWNPDECDGETHVFSLKGGNIFTRCLLRIKNLLCRKI